MFQIVPVVLAVLMGGIADVAAEGETDCGNLNLTVELAGYIPTKCLVYGANSPSARAEYEYMRVEGASSYAVVAAAHAGAHTYFGRRSMRSLVEDLMSDDEKLVWKDSFDLDGYSVQRFSSISSSERERNCVGFSRNSPAQNGRPKHRLYGFVCTTGAGHLENDSVIAFVKSVDD
jgi:hypothetical protein